MQTKNQIDHFTEQQAILSVAIFFFETDVRQNWINEWRIIICLRKSGASVERIFNVIENMVEHDILCLLCSNKP